MMTYSLSDVHYQIMLSLIYIALLHVGVKEEVCKIGMHKTRATLQQHQKEPNLRKNC